MRSKHRKYNNGGPVKPKKRRGSDTATVKTNVDRDTSFVDSEGLIRRIIDMSLINETDPYASERTEPEFKPRKIYNGEAVDPMFEEYKKESVRPKEGMVELPPKLPFPNIDLNKLPALRRVLPEIYSRKLNQQTGEYIYDTSEGEVRKKRGQEDADYVRMNRAAIDRMRQKLR